MVNVKGWSSITSFWKVTPVSLSPGKVFLQDLINLVVFVHRIYLRYLALYTKSLHCSIIILAWNKMLMMMQQKEKNSCCDTESCIKVGHHFSKWILDMFSKVNFLRQQLMSAAVSIFLSSLWWSFESKKNPNLLIFAKQGKWKDAKVFFARSF